VVDFFRNDSETYIKLYGKAIAITTHNSKF